MVNYEKALEFDENDTTLLIKAAESARQFNSYSKAAKLYSQILDSMIYTKDPSLVFHQASMYQKMGKYDEAERKFQMFKSAYENQDTFLLKNRQGTCLHCLCKNHGK